MIEHWTSSTPRTSDRGRSLLWTCVIDYIIGSWMGVVMWVSINLVCEILIFEITFWVGHVVFNKSTCEHNTCIRNQECGHQSYQVPQWTWGKWEWWQIDEGGEIRFKLMDLASPDGWFQGLYSRGNTMWIGETGKPITHEYLIFSVSSRLLLLSGIKKNILY